MVDGDVRAIRTRLAEVGEPSTLLEPPSWPELLGLTSSRSLALSGRHWMMTRHGPLGDHQTSERVLMEVLQEVAEAMMARHGPLEDHQTSGQVLMEVLLVVAGARASLGQAGEGPVR